ncbi:MAG: DUF2799 domain-containing protein [Pseudobdellovibrio sp.]|nr:DUF2799 domain-containing protein [Pseudobdellovibrio sp.]
MKKAFLFSFIAMALQFTGCASGAPKLVPSTDWEQKSVSESKATEPAVPSTPLNQETEKANLCSYSGGLAFGRQGGVYIGQCPKTLERAFKKGYLKGRAEYDQQHPQEGNK